MHFLSPGRWWLFVVLAALIVGYVLLQIFRKNYAARFTNLAMLDKVAPRRPSWRKHLPAVALLLTLIVLTLTAMRPAYAVRVPRERATVILAMDVSPSMAAGDIQPNRLAAAKDAAKKFLHAVPKQKKINIGLVKFSRSGSVVVPPTTDRAALTTGIEGLKTEKYTAIGEGIFASLDAIKLAPKPKDGSDKKVPAAIVLMSDGESTVGRSPQAGARAAAKQHVPVSTIAYGTDDGTVTIPPDPFPQRVPPDPETLQQISDITGGKFYEAESASEIDDVYKDLGSSLGYVKKYKETTGTWAFYAVGALLVSTAIGLVLSNRFP